MDLSTVVSSEYYILILIQIFVKLNSVRSCSSNFLQCVLKRLSYVYVYFTLFLINYVAFENTPLGLNCPLWLKILGSFDVIKLNVLHNSKRIRIDIFSVSNTRNVSSEFPFFPNNTVAISLADSPLIAKLCRRFAN